MLTLRLSLLHYCCCCWWCVCALVLALLWLRYPSIFIFNPPSFSFHSFIHSFIHLFAHSLTHSFLCSTCFFRFIFILSLRNLKPMCIGYSSDNAATKTGNTNKHNDSSHRFIAIPSKSALLFIVYISILKWVRFYDRVLRIELSLN